MHSQINFAKKWLRQLRINLETPQELLLFFVPLSSLVFHCLLDIFMDVSAYHGDVNCFATSNYT